MTPERIAGLVARWVRFYTRDLPEPIARRRIDEIDADLHDQIADERSRGVGDRRIALRVWSRMVRGLAADASWRGRQAREGRAHSSADQDGTRKRRTVKGSALRIVLATALILSLPLVAMQLTDEVVWSPADFAVAGFLLAGSGLGYSLATRMVGRFAYRAAVGVAIAAGFILVWLVGAVGLIGEDGDRADLMYGGVLAVAVIGSIAARLRPRGMSRALLATALAQALVAAIAVIAGKHESPVTSLPELLGLNAFFVALFGASAWLFRRAAEDGRAAGSEPQP